MLQRIKQATFDGNARINCLNVLNAKWSIEWQPISRLVRLFFSVGELTQKGLCGI